jgi:hypothetical protein
MEYKMILHLNKQQFRQAVQFTAQQMNIPAIYVEKDYWVTFVLHTIFHHPIGKETIFKGGTALLKCFDLIERFSEDIDLVVLRKDGESNSKLTNKIKEISSVVSSVLPEVIVNDVTQKMGMNRKTAHTYAKEFQENYGQVRDVIIVEATWLGYFEPYSTKKINSFIYKMMKDLGQEKLAEENGLLPFEVLVLDSTRTFCEKIMSLVRFSYTENAIDDLHKKIRHVYDLHQLLLDREIEVFFESDAFDEMLLKVANDDVASFKNNNSWLQYSPQNAIIFAEIDPLWNDLKTTYNGPFRNLVFGSLPNDEQVLLTLKRIKNRLDSVEWRIVF